MIRRALFSNKYLIAFATMSLALLFFATGCGAAGPMAAESETAAAVKSKTVNKVYITWYGFNDNSCQVESQHDCNTIAFPQGDGWPTSHDIATEGSGTYNDPNTFATGVNDNGSGAEIAVGTVIYVPMVRKYFVMEDQCYECGNEWRAKKSWHVDLWMGPSYGSANGPLMNCEDNLTQGDTYKGTGTIIINPASNLPVDKNPLFTHNKCTAHTY
jgi:hypothetical protein